MALVLEPPHSEFRPPNYVLFRKVKGTCSPVKNHLANHEIVWIFKKQFHYWPTVVSQYSFKKKIIINKKSCRSILTFNLIYLCKLVQLIVLTFQYVQKYKQNDVLSFLPHYNNPTALFNWLLCNIGSTHWVKIIDCGRPFHRHTPHVLRLTYTYSGKHIKDVYIYLNIPVEFPPTINYFHPVTSKSLWIKAHSHWAW